MNGNKSKEKKTTDRREFIRKGMRISLGISLAGIAGVSSLNATKGKNVWQIDPFKCIRCGRCADYCVLTPSAVKCFHAYQLCGYCDLCGGYLKPDANALGTAAENQLCPTSALIRRFVEEPYFVYDVDEDLCIGCGKCVEGCTSFGNGSLHLQVNQDLCKNCNECAIARVCPSDAFLRVSAAEPYLIKGGFTEGGSLEDAF